MLPAVWGLGHQSSALKLTDGAGLVQETVLQILPALDVFLAVPPVHLLADLLPALVVDALSISDS